MPPLDILPILGRLDCAIFLPLRFHFFCVLLLALISGLDFGVLGTWTGRLAFGERRWGFQEIGGVWREELDGC